MKNGDLYFHVSLNTVQNSDGDLGLKKFKPTQFSLLDI